MKGDYPVFTASGDPVIPFNELVWNQTKLNLSVRAQIFGTVPLDRNCTKYNLTKNHRTSIFRNYTLVKDGFANVVILPISASKATIKALQDHNMVTKDPTNKDVYLVDLTAVPVMNRAIADGRTSAEALCADVLTEKQIQGEIKALKEIKNRLEGDVSDVAPNVVKGTDEYLESFGIKKGLYNPPVEKEDPTDYYFAKEFKIKVKGISSLPAVSKVEEKLENNKSLTDSEALVAAGLDAFHASGVVDQSDTVQLAWLGTKLDTLKKELNIVRRSIQETKFAILLGKQWFDEFDSRDDNTLTVKDKLFTIEVTEKQVDI